MNFAPRQVGQEAEVMPMYFAFPTVPAEIFVPVPGTGARVNLQFVIAVVGMLAFLALLFVAVVVMVASSRRRDDDR